jgi:hypothetical protein
MALLSSSRPGAVGNYGSEGRRRRPREVRPPAAAVTVPLTPGGQRERMTSQPTERHPAPRPPARRGRDRDHTPGRRRPVQAAFTDAEYTDLAAAARRVGLTPTGFVADAALAVARGQISAAVGDNPLIEVLRQLMHEMFAARTALNRTGTNLNQATAALNSTGQAPVWLAQAVEAYRRSLQQFDDTTARISRRLRRAPRSD